jgi:ATP-dependent DNA helicase RecG
METKVSINSLKGVGEKTEKILNKLGVFTIDDLLHTFPRDYERYDCPRNIKEIALDEINVIEGTINGPIEQVRKGRMHILKVRVQDDTGSLYLVWFNQNYIKDKLKADTHFVFRGKVEYKFGQIQMQTPTIFTKEEYNKLQKVLQPIYPLTYGLTQKNMRSMMIRALTQTKNQLQEYLTEEIRKEVQLSEYNYAMIQIHYPKNGEAKEIARKRLAFDEFLFFQLALFALKEHRESAQNTFRIEDRKDIEELLKNLPFKLTNAQERVWEEIKQDLMSDKVMNRLVQGDVGSGKTIIAALALMLVAKNNYQGCMMAPTEVLAKQHYESLIQVLEPFGIRLGLLVGSMTAKEKRQTYKLIENQDIDVVIGTHALIQDQVTFRQLALVITDEQHRFGVKQRDTLATKGLNPHVLVMSATPIPRTLAIILYGELDISVIDELPPNRQVIKTYAVNSSYRSRLNQFIEDEINKGRQAYIICPMVEESENLDVESVIEYTHKLRKMIDPKISLAYLHGKMKAKEKNTIMADFAENKIQILVSTTVVEVGVNVPNATLMVIENAERFGLAQLHQLRGRVGRGQYQSYCILMTDTKNEKTKERLDILCKSNDGFVISEYDLKLRGPGDMFGIRQHGIIEFKIGNVFYDIQLLQKANEVAKKIIDIDPQLENDDYKGLKKKLNDYLEYNVTNMPL